jgi:Alpha/beta-hydrolase family
MIADPIAGALWSGPPFESRVWRSITENRNAGSPAWLPQFRDSRFVRFMNQNGPTVPADTPWGPTRVVYLQYASDPIVLFGYRDAYQRSVWMNPPRGPDVSPYLRWYPVVTMLQLALDMAVATGTAMVMFTRRSTMSMPGLPWPISATGPPTNSRGSRIILERRRGRQPTPTAVTTIPMATGEGRADDGQAIRFDVHRNMKGLCDV